MHTLPSETVVRERVLRLLDDAVQRPLTILSAPAGYGKTTAVRTWLEALDINRAWLALDARDNDQRRLQARISEALAEHADARLVIVLDDYHVLEHPACHELVGELLDVLPPAVRLVICTRTTPPLRLPRRRAAGTVSELGPEQLRFQDDEAERLLNDTLQLGLAPDAIKAIEARVEGWPAALALSARDPDAIAGYLETEVLDGTEPRLREFLRRTSILRRLSGPVCEAVLEDPAAHVLLAEAQRANLFVARDGSWLRYQRPFAEVLERELHDTSPQLVAVLHRRAAAWFAANGPPEEAIRHAGAAGDGERAAELLLAGWRPLLRGRRHATVRRLIAELPAERGELTGFCAALHALCLALEDADPRLVTQLVVPLGSSAGVAPVLDLLRVSHRFGNIGQAVADGWAAWERHPDVQARAMLAGPFATTLWFAGERDAVRDVVEPLLGVIRTDAGRTWALAALALVAADDGDAELAGPHACDAIETAQANREGVALGRAFAHVALAEALRLIGRLDDAAGQLAVASGLTANQPDSVDHAVTLVFQAQLALTRHDRIRARAHAAAARPTVDRYPDLGLLADRLARVEDALRRQGSDELQGSAPTAAERRVLALLASDLSVEQIAAELCLSVHTVKSHRRRLYDRLGVRSREDAIAVARQRGLI